MKITFAKATLLSAVVALLSCNTLPYILTPEETERAAALEQKLDELKTRQPEEPQGYEKGTYEYFVTHHGYPVCMLMYRNDELMAQATNDNSELYICLSQQRGRLYVNGTIAADWPVSTGTASRATSPGTYRILEKKKKHASSRYGSIRSSSGRVVVGNADARRHSVPRGGRWVGSPMPNWMRLTNYGMGMHTGHVIEGQRLSHGCIRMPDNVASPIFDIVKVGYKVVVCEGLEACYPCKDALEAGGAYNVWAREKNKLDKELKSIHNAAKERAGIEIPTEIKVY